jgi:hypothetical protein
VFKSLAYQSHLATKTTSSYTLTFTATASFASTDIFAVINFGAAAANTLFTIDNIVIKSSAVGAAPNSPQSGRRLQESSDMWVADAAAALYATDTAAEMSVLDAALTHNAVAADTDLPAGLVVEPSASSSDGSITNGVGALPAKPSRDLGGAADAEDPALMKEDPENGVFACVRASLVF